MRPRRWFLQGGTLCLAGLGGRVLLVADEDARPSARVGLVTDVHHADKAATKTRFYRESMAKLEEAVDRMDRESLDAAVELGDFIDQAASVEQEIEWLRAIESCFAKLSMPRHYVLGNHCVGTLTKREFAACTAGTGGHDRFECGGVAFLVLDTCYRVDGAPYERGNFDWRDSSLPAVELAWLEAELRQAPDAVIVLTHHRLDRGGDHAVRNAAEVRVALEQSKKVTAVFQGHSHTNDYQQISGIHYTTLAAMVEGSGADNSAYGVLDVFPDGSCRLHGFRRQVNRSLERS